MLLIMQSSEHRVSLAILGAKMIDGTGSPAVGVSALLVGNDGRIVAAGSRADIAVPRGVQVVRGEGLTLLPGLIDGHVHLSWDKSIYTTGATSCATSRNLRDPGREAHRAAGNAELALTAGVTTVRDCGADDYSILTLRDAIATGCVVGPRILACGRPLTTTAGHLYSDWGVDSTDEARRAVQTVADRGADFVKLVMSGGTTTPGTDITRAQYGLGEVRAVVEQAHQLGLPVVGHCICTDSIRIAAEAGIDTIEHCSWIGRDATTTVTDPAAVQAMVRNGVRVDHAIIPRPYLFPKEGHGSPTPEERWWLAMLRVRWPFLKIMRQAGVTIFLGTDACFGPWPGTTCWPGAEEMARAMEIMVHHAGFSPLEVIGLSTGEAARALGLDSELGTLTVGRRADLLLVRGDPLEDPRVLRSIWRVYRDGRLAAEDGQIMRSAGRRNSCCQEVR